MDKTEVKTNLTAAFVGQFVSMFSGFVLSFFIPKVIDLYNYSFWQLFLFYASFTGFFHFGINDGVYLRYGGKSFKEMNRDYVAGQFQYLAVLQVLIFLILYIILFLCHCDAARKIVWIGTATYMIFFNLSNYLGYIFQAANQTRYYSFSLIIDKISFIVCLSFLFFDKQIAFKNYITCYIVCKFLCFIYLVIKGKYFVLYKVYKLRKVFNELIESITVGIKLMFASIASMLILGIGRFFIDANWSIDIFGKVSLGLTLTVFVLAFVQQISMVLFPVLRRIGEDQHIKIFNILFSFCFFLMPLLYILVFPGMKIVDWWLPHYGESIRFWGIMIPIVVFDSQMNLLYNTFFKVYRGEKLLLKINIITLLISSSLSLIGVFILHSYLWIIYTMVISVMIRTVIAELYIKRYLKTSYREKSLWNISIGVLYLVIISESDKTLISLLLMIVLYILQLIVFRRDLILALKDVRAYLR